MRISDWSSDVCSSDLWSIAGALVSWPERKAPSPRDTAMPKGISPVSPASPRSLRLRAELPKVMRLSPKAMTILGGVSCLSISAALWWGLRATPPEAHQNLHETAERKSVVWGKRVEVRLDLGGS